MTFIFKEYLELLFEDAAPIVFLKHFAECRSVGSQSRFERDSIHLMRVIKNFEQAVTLLSMSSVKGSYLKMGDVGRQSGRQ